MIFPKKEAPRLLTLKQTYTVNVSKYHFDLLSNSSTAKASMMLVTISYFVRAVVTNYAINI